jgi:hypothetical protein
MQAMTRLLARGLALTLLVGGLALSQATPALAHDERPASLTRVDAGPYSLTVAVYTDQPVAGQDFAVLVSPAAGAGPAPERVRLVARPGLGTDATPVRAALVPDPDGPGGFAGTARLPVTGAWLLDVVVDGPAGEGRATLHMTAAAPGALPPWVGWAVGLSPLLGLVWLGWWQHRYLRRLEAAATAA